MEASNSSCLAFQFSYNLGSKLQVAVHVCALYFLMPARSCYPFPLWLRAASSNYLQIVICTFSIFDVLMFIVYCLTPGCYSSPLWDSTVTNGSQSENCRKRSQLKGDWWLSNIFTVFQKLFLGFWIDLDQPRSEALAWSLIWSTDPWPRIWRLTLS